MFPPPPSRQIGGGWKSEQYNSSSFSQGPSSQPYSFPADRSSFSTQNENRGNSTGSNFNQVNYSTSNFGAPQNRGFAQQSAAIAQQHHGSSYSLNNATSFSGGPASSHATYHANQPQSKDAFTHTATQISYPPTNIPGTQSDGSGNVQLTTAYPLWTKQTNRLPPIYRDVIRHSISQNGHHLDTGRVYSVLMTSQLPKPTLGHLWSLVNRETVGILNVPEGLMLLVLVALTQSNRIGVSSLHDISFLHQITLDPSFPTPSLAMPQNTSSQINPSMIAQQTPADSFNRTATPLQSTSVTGFGERGMSSLSNHSSAPSQHGSQSLVNTPVNQQRNMMVSTLATEDVFGAQQAVGFNGRKGEEYSNEIDHESNVTQSKQSHCRCMESSCDGFNPDIAVGVGVGGEFDVEEEDGGVVYIAEDILYSGGESESQADSYQSSSCSSPGQMASAYNSPKHVVSTNQTPVAVAPPFQLPTEPSTPVNSQAPKMVHHSQRPATNFDYITTMQTSQSYGNRNQNHPLPFPNRQNSGSSLASPKIPLSTLATFSASFSPTNSGKQVVDDPFGNVQSSTQFASQSSSKQETGDDFGDFADFESAAPQPSLSPYLANILNNQNSSRGNSSVNASVSTAIPISSMSSVNSAIEVKTNWPVGWPARDRTISSSSTISSHSTKLPSVLNSPGAALSPSLRFVAAAGSAPQILSTKEPKISPLSVTTGYEQQHQETEKDSWFNKFQNVEPQVPTGVTENDDDDFADFQNFTDAVSGDNSVPVANEILNSDKSPKVSNDEPFDKYAAFRDLVTDLAHSEPNSDINVLCVPQVEENNDSKTKCELVDSKSESFDIAEVFVAKQLDGLQIVEENETDFADFASFSNAVTESVQSGLDKNVPSFVGAEVIDNSFDFIQQARPGNFASEETGWANFDSHLSKTSESISHKLEDRPGLNDHKDGLNIDAKSNNFDSSDGGLFPVSAFESASESLKETVSQTVQKGGSKSWANFEAFGEQTLTWEPKDPISMAESVSTDTIQSYEPQVKTEVEAIASEVSPDKVTEVETGDEWTAFRDEESSTVTTTGADVSGLIWAKQQVSADGLYDRIKQTIMSEEVKKPATSMANVANTVWSYEKGENSTTRNGDTSAGSEGGGVELTCSGGGTKKNSAKGLSTERFLGLEKDFEFSDGTRQRKVWSKLVTECEQIMKCGLEAVQLEDNQRVKEEVTSSKQWSSFCTGLCLVYGVVMRIKRSFTVAKLYDYDLSQMFDRFGQIWSELKQFFPEEVLSSSVYVSSTSEEYFPATAAFGAEACGVCLLRAIEDVNHKDESTSLKAGKTDQTSLKYLSDSSRIETSRSVDRSLHCLSFGGRSYHAPCANLWVNKVDLVLPALLVIDVL